MQLEPQNWICNDELGIKEAAEREHGHGRWHKRRLTWSIIKGEKMWIKPGLK